MDNFDKLSTLILWRVLYRLIGEVNNVKIVKECLIVMKTLGQLKWLPEIKRFGDYDIEVTQ